VINLWNFFCCCDQKARAASARSFTLSQQATIKITTRSLYCCLFAPRICRWCSSRTFRSWWTAHSPQRQRSGRNIVNAKLYTINIRILSRMSGNRFECFALTVTLETHWYKIMWWTFNSFPRCTMGSTCRLKKVQSHALTKLKQTKSKLLTECNVFSFSIAYFSEAWPSIWIQLNSIHGRTF